MTFRNSPLRRNLSGWTVCLAAALLAPTMRSQSTNSITSVRFWSQGDSTRVAIEMASADASVLKYHAETLQSPDRLFLDLPQTRVRIGEKPAQLIKVGDKLVKQIRVAQKEPTTARVVLDLERPVQYEISLLANPTRIIVEVKLPLPPVETTSTPKSPPVEEKAVAPEPPPLKPSAAPPEAPKVEVAKAEPARVEAAKPEPAKAQPETATTPKPQPAPREAKPSAVPVAEPKAAKPNSGGDRSLTRALGLKLGKVVLDPGHGGQDHGTTGPTGLTEKDLVLDIAQRLGALIEQRLGSEVVYTRSTDVFVPLEERGAMANETRADLFLSIHANSSPVKNISGAEVYYLNFTSSKDALDLAARENASHDKSIFELRELIQKIALKDKLDESRDFASKMQISLSTTWAKMNVNSKNRGVKKAPFVVLIGASMPSVLAEIGFISNPRDEALLKKPETRQRIAEALFKGIQQYAATLSQMQAAKVGSK